MWTDAMINEHYAADYYGIGTNYFEPPECDELDEVEDDLNELLGGCNDCCV